MAPRWAPLWQLTMPRGSRHSSQRQIIQGFNILLSQTHFNYINKIQLKGTSFTVPSFLESQSSVPRRPGNRYRAWRRQPLRRPGAAGAAGVSLSADFPFPFTLIQLRYVFKYRLQLQFKKTEDDTFPLLLTTTSLSFHWASQLKSE